jgi:hypothetical protein
MKAVLPISSAVLTRNDVVAPIKSIMSVAMSSLAYGISAAKPCIVCARTTMVGERWIIVTDAASFSHRSTQISCAELLEPMTIAFFPSTSSRP